MPKIIHRFHLDLEKLLKDASNGNNLNAFFDLKTEMEKKGYEIFCSNEQVDGAPKDLLVVATRNFSNLKRDFSEAIRRLNLPYYSQEFYLGE